MSTLRGAHIAPFISQSNLDDLYALGANLVRYPLYANTDDPVEWLKTINDQMLQLSNLQNRKNIVPVIAYPPGGLLGNGAAKMFGSKALKEILVNKWKLLARHFKGDDTIIAYDLANELQGSSYQVNRIQKRLVREIRKIDKEKVIIITSPYGDPQKFSRVEVIPGDSKIWYTCHMYHSLPFTHQKVYPQYSKAITYPTKRFNINNLKRFLKPVRDFQLKHNARIYCGEFGCSVFTDSTSRLRWFMDCIQIFKEYGWHWSYHAYREWSGWDIEGDPLILKLFKDSWK